MSAGSATHDITVTAPAVGGGVRWGRQWRRTARSTVVLLGVGFAVLVVVTALFADALAPYAPDEQNFDLIEARPGAQAVFGTDRFGRDVLSRVIHGSRISLYVALTSIVSAMAVGGALGLIAGYVGGAWDNGINRLLDVFFSVPGLLLAVGIAAMRGPGVNSAVPRLSCGFDARRISNEPETGVSL